MQKKILVILLSFNLLFLGCSSKSVNLDTTSDISSSEINDNSMAHKVLYGGVVVGLGAVMLTTIAVAILLLMPKSQGQR